MLNQIKRFLKNESGAAAIEYGLLASGISGHHSFGQERRHPAGEHLHHHPARVLNRQPGKALCSSAFRDRQRQRRWILRRVVDGVGADLVGRVIVRP